MNKTVKKIGLILLIIIILPTAFLTINEISSLNENEKVLGEIYTDQLEAILFSVNQYSEDVVSSWASRVDDLLDRLEMVNEKESARLIDSMFNDIPSLVGIFIADSVGDEQVEIYPWKENFIFDRDYYDTLNVLAQKILMDNQKIIRRLFTYKRGGYRKIEPIITELVEENAVLIFIDETPQKISRLTALLVEPREFIQRILSPKIQEIAEEGFVISIMNPNEGYQFNSTKDFNVKEVQQERALWIFPNYKVGISLAGKTIEDIVEQRAMTNIILISLLTLVLILGVWIVYKNVKREVEIAQIKSDFLSNVSHELRTPLALISMFAETLEMERVPSDEKKKEYYTIISQEANRLGRIVNTILNFSKMEAGKRTFHFKETELNDFIELIYNNYNFHLKNKGFDFNFTRQEGLPTVSLDEEAASEAIINLIDNAVKYSDDKKEIDIIAGEENGFAFVEVIDKGIGVADEDAKKIFDKFYRISTGLVHNTKGTGLGLTLVKYIMDAHKGSVRLKSTLGNGSSFKLLFPFTQLKGNAND
jgi:two-component system phosphate regulon sensor histidine kinase PhoR